MPTAANIKLVETLELLDGEYAAVARGVGEGEYAFWLGSGLSRERIIGLGGVLQRLIEFLRVRVTAAGDCRFRHALDQIISLANPSAAERAGIDYEIDSSDWPCLRDLLSRLINAYSAVLSVEIDGASEDFLLWEGTDFPHTFANEEPDAGHLAIALLVLEGAVSQLASANWDGLVEAAARELVGAAEIFRVAVKGADVRGPQAAATLYKFHGCALRAIEDEAQYRELVIARVAQLQEWLGHPAFEMMRQLLITLAATRKTLMVGLSAQDPNIQQIFTQARAQQEWAWDSEPTPHIFAEEQLQEGQKVILRVSYGADYTPNRGPIQARARLPAYANSLLPALALHVLTQKLTELMDGAEGPHLVEDDRSLMKEGLRHLRNQAAGAGEADRLAFMRNLARLVARAKKQLQEGASPPGSLPYIPLCATPVHQIAGDGNLAPTGQREAAAALALVGLGVRDGDFAVSVGDPAQAATPPFSIESANGRAKVFMVANSAHAVRLMADSIYAETDDDVVVLHSSDILLPQQRSPRAERRSGSVGVRNVDVAGLMRDASDLANLRKTFREGLAL